MYTKHTDLFQRQKGKHNYLQDQKGLGQKRKKKTIMHPFCNIPVSQPLYLFKLEVLKLLESTIISKGKISKVCTKHAIIQ